MRIPKSCTREQVRDLDRRAIEEYGIPGVVLMENAGRAAAEIAADMLGDAAGKRAVIFCGKGNNGGDGYVIARHLHNRGVKVSLVLACEQSAIPGDGDAGINLAITRAMGIPLYSVESAGGAADAAALTRKADILVDALLGTGLQGDVRDPYLSLIRLINAADAPVLSVDIPSGLDANTGNVLRAAVRATRTATFVLPKRGFYLGEGPSHTGEVAVIDIGMPRELVESLGEVASDDEMGLLPEEGE